MKFFIILIIFTISYNIYTKEINLSIENNKNMFFIFSSDTSYEIKSNNRNCIIIAPKYSKGSKIFQKAIYIKSLNYENCKNKNLDIMIRYKPQKEIIIPIVLKKNTQKFSQINNNEVKAMFTPSKILMIEILKEKSKDKIIPFTNTDGSKYKITFPWLCLEYCSGDSGAEIAEFSRNKDSLSSVSYERFTIDGGNLSTLNMTDPTPTILENNLTAWPMIRSNSRTYTEDEMATNLNNIWNNKETIATNMVNKAINNNYAGYCMDIEFQTSRNTTKSKYMDIINFFAEKLHQHDKKLMIAHAHWATMATMNDLKNTSADFVATMDPYTSSNLFFKKNNDETQGQAYEDYNQIEHNRLIWAFAWEYHTKSTQNNMWTWLQTNGYNEGVAGAAVWRAPAENSCKSGCNMSTEGIDYYKAFKQYYPIDKNINTICQNISCSNHGVCQETENQATCNCYEGYHSIATECIKNIESCTENIICSNHGNCDDSTGIVKCNCETGYINAGLDCIKNTSTKKKIIKTISSESFKRYGSLPYFHNKNTGLNKNSLWCYEDKNSENKFSLTFYSLTPGKYRIFTYIPSVNNLAKNIKYSIKNGINIKTATINQIQNKGDWGYLGEFNLNENLEISLSCYGENINLKSFKKIYFSAIKLELMEE